jgi:hypothetical protein
VAWVGVRRIGLGSRLREFVVRVMVPTNGYRRAVVRLLTLSSTLLLLVEAVAYGAR